MSRFFSVLFRWLPVGLLALMAGLSLISLVGDAPTIDERAHLPAGYTYITQGDMRLNPEHPPLIKDLAGLSLLVGSTLTNTPVTVPYHLPHWTTDTNGQWLFGSAFLFDFNSVRSTLYWGRLPTLLVMLAFGWWLYHWVRKQFGRPAGLITLALYTLSPTFLGHGHYVTTDVGAAVVFFAGLVALTNWITQPTRRHFWLAVLALGVGLLTKFSVLLLLPVGAVLWVVWTAWHWPGSKQAATSAGLFVVLLAAAFTLVVAPVYAWHMRNYPVAKQQTDLPRLLPDAEEQPLVQRLQQLAPIPVVRGLAHYATGVQMVRDRTETAGQVYFQGAIHPRGQVRYFPVLYILKEPLTYHLLTLAALVFWLWRRSRKQSAVLTPQRFLLWSCVLLIVVYWYSSLRSDLNIGIRHVLPTFPLLYLLTAVGVVEFVRRLPSQRQRIGWAVVVGVLVAQAVSVIRVTPHHLSYYNALAGGPANGWKTASDSNLDWGQDYWRLVDFVRERGIEKIAIDYFGDARFEQDLPGVAEVYHVEYGPRRGWLAVSIEYLSFERAKAGPGIVGKTNRYQWLDAFDPVATIGHSIVVYDIP